ncbi:hypothetical protein [Roseburia inulinivorans]
MNEVIEYRNYAEYKQELDTELKKTAEGFVRIGYLLKVARDTRILAESGYQNVVEFAKAEYGIDKTQVSRFMNINDKFSEGGYAPELKAEYQGFGYAKLSIMLSLPDEVNEVLTPDLSKSEIQQLKEDVDEEKKTTDIEVMLEEKDSVQQSLDTNLEKTMYQLGKDAPEIYKKLWISAVKNGETGKHFIENLIPNEQAVYTVRIPGVGAHMLAITENSDEVKLLNLRDASRNEMYSKEDIENAFGKISHVAGTWRESWEKEYGEKLPEEKGKVAPVQPKSAPRKESKVISTIKKKDDVQQAAEPPKEQTLHDVDPKIPKPDPKNTEENVTDPVINDSETNKNVVNSQENVSKPEENVSEQGENVPEEQIPGQDDIMNHPEYLPEKKTDKQIIEDAKRTVEAIRLTINDWEYTIPQGMLAAILDRVEYLKETLQELVKGDANEDDV